ncbi:hypothetical protein [Paenibacillus sp. S-12]|uniref:hypothetical protein n=1 Tax=Paenibacillus sp. S-12 TaxID=3031371 RepID=UPI0025A2D384|nr:hypothetical protein [Paenibacillus sp. S-12]
MNLADMLSYADINQLTRIAQRYGCVCNEHSKHELIQSILSALGRRDVFEQHVSEMTLEELRFLNSILFDRRASFSLEELIARVQQTRFDLDSDGGEKQAHNAAPMPHPRDTISKFKHSGWLFNGCSHQTKYLFQVPSDLKLRLIDVLRQSFAMHLTETDTPTSYRDEDGRMAEDVLHLLKFIENGNVMLNAEGVMYKKTQQQLLDYFAVQEAPIARGEWRFGYGRRFHDYPNRMSLLYDYAFYQGWLEEGDGRLSCTPKGLERVASGGVESSASLYRFWLKLYKNAIPNLLSIVHWIQLCTKQWTTLDSLERALLPFVRPFFFDTPQSVFRQRIIMMLVHLGVIRFGEDEQYGSVIQTTRRGQLIIDSVYVAHEDKIQLEVDKRHSH